MFVTFSSVSIYVPFICLVIDIAVGPVLCLWFRGWSVYVVFIRGLFLLSLPLYVSFYLFCVFVCLCIFSVSCFGNFNFYGWSGLLSFFVVHVVVCVCRWFSMFVILGYVHCFIFVLFMFIFSVFSCFVLYVFACLHFVYNSLFLCYVFDLVLDMSYVGVLHLVALPMCLLVVV